MMYRDVQCYGENLSLMAKIDLIVETCGGNCFFLTAIRICCLLRATSGVLTSLGQVIATTGLRNQARRSGRRVFSSATYSCIRMSELKRVARNGAGANPPQLNVSTLPAAKRSNVV